MMRCCTWLLYRLEIAARTMSRKPLTWENGGAGGTRTRDRGIMSPLL
jgi:hypothetical protein